MNDDSDTDPQAGQLPFSIRLMLWGVGLMFVLPLAFLIAFLHDDTFVFDDVTNWLFCAAILLFMFGDGPFGKLQRWLTASPLARRFPHVVTPPRCKRIVESVQVAPVLGTCFVPAGASVLAIAGHWLWGTVLGFVTFFAVNEALALVRWLWSRRRAR